jgi:hypothetical protein
VATLQVWPNGEQALKARLIAIDTNAVIESRLAALEFSYRTVSWAAGPG